MHALGYLFLAVPVGLLLAPVALLAWDDRSWGPVFAFAYVLAFFVGMGLLLLNGR